jgi:16S rRNA G1207 methylase RsmC
LAADELIKKSKAHLQEGGLLYIATDERDKSFFDPFKEHYEIVFLDDFKHLLKGINTK